MFQVAIHPWNTEEDQFAAAQTRALVLQEEEGHFSREDLVKVLPHELVSYDYRN